MTGLLSDVELLFVLAVIGILLLLGIRSRTRTYNVILVLIVAVLLLALIFLSKVAMTLFGVTLILGTLVVLFALMYMRRSWRLTKPRSQPHNILSVGQSKGLVRREPRASNTQRVGR